MSLFSAALRVTGLSTKEASSFLSEQLGRTVSQQTVLDMSSGRSRVNPEVWEVLRTLYQMQVRASEEGLDLINEHQPDEVEYTTVSGAGDWPSERVKLNTAAMVLLGDDSAVA